MGGLNVIVDGDAQLATGYQASGNYFTVSASRRSSAASSATADDHVERAARRRDQPRLLEKRFAGAPSVLGRVVSINGQPVTIVGVMPRDFAGIQRLGADAPDVTVPLALDAVFSPPRRLPDETRRRAAHDAADQLVAAARRPTQARRHHRAGAGQLRDGLPAHRARPAWPSYMAALTAEEKNLCRTTASAATRCRSCW